MNDMNDYSPPSSMAPKLHPGERVQISGGNFSGLLGTYLSDCGGRVMARVVVDGIPGRQGCTYRHVSIRFLQPVGSAGGSPRTATVPDEVTSVFEQPAAKCSTKLSSIRDGVEERSIYYDSKQFESSEETDPSSLDIAKELRDVRREMACLKVHRCGVDSCLKCPTTWRGTGRPPKISSLSRDSRNDISK